MKTEIISKLLSMEKRSAWKRAVIDDAIDMIDAFSDNEIILASEKNAVEKLLLNGALNWDEYSAGGCALVYDGDIAEHYCTPSELRRSNNGDRAPNNRETWLDVQARALRQAARLIVRIVKEIMTERREARKARHEELELMRHNVTPANFAAYVRHMLKKNSIDHVDIDFEYWKRGGDLEFDYYGDASRPCMAEKSISKPYRMQTYLKNWNGSVYNLIMEFEYWDAKTGNGYFYFYNDLI